MSLLRHSRCLLFAVVSLCGDAAILADTPAMAPLTVLRAPAPVIRPTSAELPDEEPLAPVTHKPRSFPIPSPIDGPTGPISVDGRNVSFDYLSKLVDDGIATGCGPNCASCGGRQCAPGLAQHEAFPVKGPITHVIGALYDAVVRPDPCYQPKWTPLADSAYFVDAARPVSHTRLRWEFNSRWKFPDRAEYLFARGDGQGKGPVPTAGNGLLSIPFVDISELSQYTEIATGNVGVTVQTTYRAVDPTDDVAARSAGFSDIILGTKTLLLDSELLLLSLQFRTYLPSGNFRKGLGTGHVSLEPSLIIGLATSRRSYLQAQVGQWIPLGGDPEYSGGILRHNLSFNYQLWKPIEDVQLIGTWEYNGYSFQDGAYTHPVRGSFQRASHSYAFQTGPGFRLFFSDKIDFGTGHMFGFGDKRMAAYMMRLELRIRY